MSFWSVIEWLDSVLPQASLAALYALTLTTLCALIREWFHSRNTRRNLRNDVKTQKSGRELDSMENLRYKGCLGNGCTQSIVFCLKSKVPLNITLVRETFTLLMDRHPLLAVGVDTHEEAKAPRNRVRYFSDMKEEAILDFSLKRTSADQWKEKFQRELNKSFCSNQVAIGPLWRVAVLKENFLREEEAYENAIIITAHPVICDGISLVKLCDQLLQILNSHPELEKGTIRLPIRPAISNLLRHVLALSTFGKVFLAIKAILEGLLKKMKGGAKNQIKLVFPPPKLSESSIMKRTSVIPLTFSKGLMQKLLIVCKQKGCSIHSVMIAVSAVAMATVLQNGLLVVPMKIPFVFEWSIRKNCRPQIDDSEFGCYILDCRKEVSVPAVNIGSSDFWYFVVACMKKLHSAISKGEHFQELKILNELSLRTKTNIQREDTLFRLSSIFQHEIVEDTNTTYNFNGMQFASEIDDSGPVFGNNIVSLNGKLFWSVAYSTRTVTDSLANAFAEHVKSILHKICS